MNEFSSLKHVQHVDAHSSNDTKTKTTTTKKKYCLQLFGTRAR